MCKRCALTRVPRCATPGQSRQRSGWGGSIRVDESVDLVMQPVGKSATSFSPTILDVQQERHLIWRGRLLLQLVFDGTHHFMLEALDGGRSRFVQYEEFQGVFVPFVSLEPYRQGWARMNGALKEAAEAQERALRAPPGPAVAGSNAAAAGRPADSK